MKSQPTAPLPSGLVIAICELFLLSSTACALSSSGGLNGYEQLANPSSVAENEQSNSVAGRKVNLGGLGPGDVLEVRVFEEDNLSGVYRVNAEGNIDYPLCGRVMVVGLDASGAGDAIADCLRDGFIRHPQVSVFIKEHLSSQVFIFGQVNKPGTFTYREGMTVIEAITRAEGFTKLAAKNSVVVTRVVDGREQRLRIPIEDIGVGRSANFILSPGDIVFVPESFF